MRKRKKSSFSTRLVRQCPCFWRYLQRYALRIRCLDSLDQEASSLRLFEVALDLSFQHSLCSESELPSLRLKARFKRHSSNTMQPAASLSRNEVGGVFVTNVNDRSCLEKIQKSDEDKCITSYTVMSTGMICPILSAVSAL